MLPMILEAAFRSLLMAVAVWAGIRMMRLQAVLAQKVAWVLVLLAAGTMPFVMRTPWLALNRALRIPIRSLPSSPRPSSPWEIQTPAVSLKNTSFLQAGLTTENFAEIAKPAPIHSYARSFNHSTKTLRLAEPLTAAKPQSASVSLAASAAFINNPAPTYISEAGFWNWARIKQMLAILYLAVGAVLLLRTFAGLGIAFRIWRRSKPIANPANGIIPSPAKHLVRVRISPDLSTPVTIGSTVILPADYADWDEAKLRIVLAHEQSHVRQGDFYLQLFAALHVAVFWFSPLGWWLQRTLSELGEALSDRAGLEEAPSPSSYAQVLLEFAARPRTTPLAGVAMAHNSNLSSRMERILNVSRFRLAFLGGRRHAILAATLVPAVLVAVVACIRIVPTVEAAQGQNAIPTGPICVQTTGRATGQGTSAGSGQMSGKMADQVMTTDIAQETSTVPAVSAVAPVAPNPNSPAPDVAALPAQEPAPAPEPVEAVAPVPPTPPEPSVKGVNDFHFSTDDDGDDPYAIVHGDEGNTISMTGNHNKELDEIRRKYHGNYIWFERDGKSYVITDPAIVAQSQNLFKGNEALNRMQAELDKKQAVLDKKMADLQPEMDNARLPGPEFEAQMAKLRQQLAALQGDEYKKLTETITKQVTENKKAIDEATLEITQQKLGDLQGKIGDIQGQIGEIQGKIGERQGEIGEKQGAIGEEMGKLGEEMGRIGEQQGKIAEEASRKLKSVFDQAIKDGKAKPVD
jgi:beta-lactamase regulating signal transducer with metallopeptidase domain/predicted  nucleic acid-binding Zn-ribbon protein